jgi:hypothetical protein
MLNSKFAIEIMIEVAEKNMDVMLPISEFCALALLGST